MLSRVLETCGKIMWAGSALVAFGKIVYKFNEQ